VHTQLEAIAMNIRRDQILRATSLVAGVLVLALQGTGCTSSSGEPTPVGEPGPGSDQGGGGSGGGVAPNGPAQPGLGAGGSSALPGGTPEVVSDMPGVLSPPASVPPPRFVAFEAAPDRFPIASAGAARPLVVSASDFPGVRRVAGQLQADVGKVSGVQPALLDDVGNEQEVILIGTIGKSDLIDRVIADGKLDVSGVQGRWEAFVAQAVEAPLPGVARALVIAGSDKRGTIYGMYELSDEIGVSPWYYWADVPVEQHAELHALPGAFTLGEPAVKYRGFFLNDEAPALSGWAYEKFGGFNSDFYAHVFELLLRLKGNYLWPAMWGRAFNDEDPENADLADELGVVMGTSHHEPMSRAQAEWERYGSGAWDYQTNAAALRTFWEGGIRRLGNRDAIITLGMRGDGDVALSATADIALLERIVSDQRDLLSSVLPGRALTDIPQVWTLYKEVQDYYDQGMRVPDDVTLLFADDNWGNIRKLPKLEDAPRAGGYGVYFHYDYVGGPRNYKWLNTSPIARTWEQMSLARAYGADRIWIVNVGDLKPVEFPTQFFLDYAWSPERLGAQDLGPYTERWAARQFGAERGAEVAELIAKYTKFNGRRKPELLAPGTYSLSAFREAETVVAEYNALSERAQALYDALPAPQKDAFYQLVLFPVQACANLNELYVAAAQNALYAEQGRAATNERAARVAELFARDATLTRYYNQTLAGGKWNHFMDQTHIGYTDWQEPAQNNAPATRQLQLPAGAEMGVALEGSDQWWPSSSAAPTLPDLSQFEARAERYIDVFNRGQAAFDFTATASVPWLSVSPAQGTVTQQTRLTVSVSDWSQVPAGLQSVPVTISGASGRSVVVQASVDNRATPPLAGFVESNGYVSIEAEHYTSVVGTADVQWLRIPDLGRTLSAMTPFPLTAPAQTAGGESPRLEYAVHLVNSGTVTVRAFLSPGLNFHGAGLRYALSIDDGEPQVIDMHGDTSEQYWQEWVSDNINVSSSEHTVEAAGDHVLKFWMVDAGVVLQKLLLETRPVPASYLGPPESRFFPPEPAASSLEPVPR
jgi:hypothetical protein